MYVKLFGSILDSSIWVGTDPATKLVWLTMMVMADEFGMVHAALPGIAKRAEVSLEECERVMEILEGPDPHSRTPDNGGRRIEKVDGGWLLLNHKKYREIRTQRQLSDAARQRRHRDKSQENVTSNDVTTDTDTEAEADTDA